MERWLFLERCQDAFNLVSPITRFRQLIVSCGTWLLTNSKSVQFQRWTFLAISKRTITKASGATLQKSTLVSQSGEKMSQISFAYSDAGMEGKGNSLSFV